MKRSIIAVLALASVVACNKTDVVDQPKGNAIAFENAFIDNSTKSVDDPSFTNEEMFSDFAVYGFVNGATAFDGTQVSKTISNDALTSVWKYNGTQYWIVGANYNFSAVAPYTDAKWTKTACAVSDKAINTALSFTNDGTQDLLYSEVAQITGQAQDNPMVAFTFRHLLSKVKFSFENGYNATNATIAVSDIKITNAYQTGNVALTASTTTWSGQAGTLELNFGAATDDEATTNVAEAEAKAYAYPNTYESHNELLLIPGQGPTTEVVGEEGTTSVTGYTVTFKVTLYVSGTEIASYPHSATIDFTPEPGKSYDIKTTITADNINPDAAQEPIEFTVNALPEWGESVSVE